jgi:alpha-L-rhamnosidase
VWDNNENVSPWSDISFWEMGLLNTDDWESEWIEPGFDEDISVSQPAPMLRSEFSLKTGIVSARAYVTAHGLLYEMHINGRRVGQDLFTPGWTSYNQRLQYQTYDITGHLQEGENAVGVWLGDGWFRGFLGWGDQRNSYGEKLGLACPAGNTGMKMAVLRLLAPVKTGNHQPDPYLNLIYIMAKFMMPALRIRVDNARI